MPSTHSTHPTPGSEDERLAKMLGFHMHRRYRPSPKTDAFTRRIRRIATELFAERGIIGVTLADVSRAAELGPTHLQYYFGRREHLLYDILLEHIENLLKTASETVTRNQEAANGPAWAHDLILSLLRDVTATERDAHRVLRHTLHVLPKVQQDGLQQRLRYLRIALAQPLALAARLEWTDPRLDPLAHALLAMIGDAALWLPQQDEAARASHATLLTGMALHGARALTA